MWQKMSMLAFCGTLAFGANVCNGLPTHPPVGTDFLAVPRQLAFRISVKPAGPSFRITVRPLLLKWPAGNSDPVHAGDIEVAGCQDGKLLQMLPITARQPINFGSTFRTDDINFDGYLDFHLLTEFAGKWGSESYWVYDPAAGRFAENELTRKLGENCLGAEWRGCWKANAIEFDAKRHEISARYLVGVGQCGSPVDRYRVEDNRLVVVHKEVLDMNVDGCTVTVSDRVAGSMRLRQVRRYDARGEPLK